MTRKDKTHLRAVEQRRLDTLARILTGNSICAAVAFDKADNQLIISTNLLSAPDATTLNTYFAGTQTPAKPSPANIKLAKSLDLLAHCTSQPVETVRNTLYPLVLNYSINSCLALAHTSIARLQKAVAGATAANLINKELLKQYLNNPTSYDTLATLIRDKDQMITTMSWGSDKEHITKFLNSLPRIMQEIDKVCEILLTDKFPDLKAAICAKQFLLVGPHDTDMHDIHHKSAHAEMNLAHHLLTKGGTWYVGLSKLTCFDCTNDIVIINNTGKLTLLTRGEHNVKYQDTRIIPKFPGIHEDEFIYYRDRFGELQESEKTKTLESADFSDSEAELPLMGDVAAAAAAAP